MRLFDVESVNGWKGSRALVPVESIECAWCGPTFLMEYAQPALFFHGGFGAVEGVSVRSCNCGAIRVISRATLNPRLLG